MRKSKIRLLTVLILFLVSTSYLFSQNKYLDQLISDTLFINQEEDSLNYIPKNTDNILDNRKFAENVLAIEETKKYMYIPVDQYIAFKKPIAEILDAGMQNDSISLNNILVIGNLSFWYDSKPLFNKSKILNGHTSLIDTSGNTIKDWQWEFRSKKKKKQENQDNILILFNKWKTAQLDSLQNPALHRRISPYKYRRQLISWFDFICFQDGYVINAHFTLDFPADQRKSYIRGSAGIYYRKSSLHQSIGVKGDDLQWYYRLNPNWLARLNSTMRIGFNNFDTDKFEQMDLWNLMMVNLGITASLEYRPVYLKGFFCGAGIHQNINILPDILDRFETGILLTVGVLLP